MAMPTSDQTALRALEQRASELRAEIAAAQMRTEAPTHEVGDWKDAALDSALDDIAGAEVERDMAELRDIAHAIQHIAEGRYGRCQDCGEPIQQARLVAQPAAVRCVECQGLAELHRPTDART